MSYQEKDPVLQQGLSENGISRHGSGKIWDTFLTEDYVVQAPPNGSPGRLEKNSHFYRLLNENDVPAPEVIETHNKSPFYGKYERIDGIDLYQASESIGHREFLEAIEEVGRTLGRDMRLPQEAISDI